MTTVKFSLSFWCHSAGCDSDAFNKLGAQSVKCGEDNTVWTTWRQGVLLDFMEFFKKLEKKWVHQPYFLFPFISS